MRKWMNLAAAAAACVWASLAPAQGMFLPTEDFRLREDLQLLVDEDVIRLPMNTWPLPAKDVREALKNLKPETIHSAALRAAAGRVNARIGVRPEDSQWRLQEVRMTAGEPALLRDAETLGRETAELRAMGGVRNDRWSTTIALTGVVDPQDDKAWRLDGSELSVRWGNWLLSANQIDRWWGPGHGGGIILSSNARPMAAVSLDRIESSPWDLPLLRWLGPWRYSLFFSAMEKERPDVNKSLFMGMRFSFKPASILELGLSRTAQFCGEDRPCDAETFFNVLMGKDNADIRVDPEAEPGNQMAGFDARLVSPFKPLPIALYAELIGEDGGDDRIPQKYLAEFGVEGWWMTEAGNTWRARAEYANTSCIWSQPGEQPDCGYRQHIYFAGYRYRDRTIGHTTDSDSETWAFQLLMTTYQGDRWGLQYRGGELDRFGAPDQYNPLTYGPSDYDSLEMSWNGLLWGQDIGVQLGYEKQKGQYVDESGAFGFIQWRKPL